jgi:hypothetical protein
VVEREVLLEVAVFTCTRLVGSDHLDDPRVEQRLEHLTGRPPERALLRRRSWLALMRRAIALHPRRSGRASTFRSIPWLT